MPKPIRIDLTSEQRNELEWVRDHHQKPYLREKASAILKVANGQSGRSVALNGLLKKRKTDTIYDWIKRYKEEGMDGLIIKPGRGRKPSMYSTAPN